MKPSSPQDFVGWHRPHSRAPWRPVCHGASPDFVLGKLLDTIKGGDRAVLRNGVNPNDQPREILRAYR